MQDTAKACALRSWVDRKHFPIDDYCQKIDDADAFLQGSSAAEDAATTDEHAVAAAEEDTVSNDQLVALIAMLLDNEGALVAYCLKHEIAIMDKENWLRICEAAAWVLLQRYQLRVKKGEWPT